MSRWSKRSEQEKRNLARGLQANGTPVSPTRKHVEEPLSPEDALRIYRNREIPIVCPSCLAWRRSEKYEMGYFETVMGMPSQRAVRGHCNLCAREMQRVLPSDPGEQMLFMAILNDLRRVGRVTGSW